VWSDVTFETFATALGLALFVGTLAIFYAITGTLTRSWFAAGAATLVLGLLPSFAAFATGGLETELQTCLVTATCALAISGIRRQRPSPRVRWNRHNGALAMLTRMDSVLIVAPVIALYAWFIVAFHRVRPRPRW
jgi:arabinofuranosyltransferase